MFKKTFPFCQEWRFFFYLTSSKCRLDPPINSELEEPFDSLMLMWRVVPRMYFLAMSAAANKKNAFHMHIYMMYKCATFVSQKLWKKKVSWAHKTHMHQSCCFFFYVEDVIFKNSKLSWTDSMQHVLWEPKSILVIWIFGNFGVIGCVLLSFTLLPGNCSIFLFVLMLIIIIL